MIPEGFAEVSVEHISKAFDDSCVSNPCQALSHTWQHGRGDQTLASVICTPAVTPLQGALSLVCPPEKWERCWEGIMSGFSVLCGPVTQWAGNITRFFFLCLE